MENYGAAVNENGSRLLGFFGAVKNKVRDMGENYGFGDSRTNAAYEECIDAVEGTSVVGYDEAGVLSPRGFGKRRQPLQSSDARQNAASYGEACGDVDAQTKASFAWGGGFAVAELGRPVLAEPEPDAAPVEFVQPRRAANGYRDKRETVFFETRSRESEEPAKSVTVPLVTTIVEEEEEEEPRRNIEIEISELDDPPIVRRRSKAELRRRRRTTGDPDGLERLHGPRDRVGDVFVPRWTEVVNKIVTEVAPEDLKEVERLRRRVAALEATLQSAGGRDGAHPPPAAAEKKRPATLEETESALIAAVVALNAAAMLDYANVAAYESHVEALSNAVEQHPERKLRDSAARNEWVERETAPRGPATMALETIRGFVPADVQRKGVAGLVADGVRPELARRIVRTKALWLVQKHPDDIARQHVADLTQQCAFQGLDIVEARAVWAAVRAVPFHKNDNDGRKTNWFHELERRVRELASLEDAGKLQRREARHDVYDDYEPAVYEATATPTRQGPTAVCGAFAPTPQPGAHLRPATTGHVRLHPRGAFGLTGAIAASAKASGLGRDDNDNDNNNNNNNNNMRSQKNLSSDLSAAKYSRRLSGEDVRQSPRQISIKRAKAKFLAQESPPSGSRSYTVAFGATTMVSTLPRLGSTAPCFGSPVPSLGAAADLPPSPPVEDGYDSMSPPAPTIGKLVPRMLSTTAVPQTVHHTEQVYRDDWWAKEVKAKEAASALERCRAARESVSRAQGDSSSVEARLVATPVAPQQKRVVDPALEAFLNAHCPVESHAALREHAPEVAADLDDLKEMTAMDLDDLTIPKLTRRRIFRAIEALRAA